MDKCYLKLIFFTLYFSVSHCQPQCPAGWVQFDQDCYRFHPDPTPVTFYNAQWICREIYEATVLPIQSRREQLFLNDYVFNNQSCKKDVWLGGLKKSSSIREDFSNHGFVWLDGSNFSYSNWALAEPSRGESEYCLIMQFASNIPTVGLWYDRSCEYSYSVVCKKDLVPRNHKDQGDHEVLIKTLDVFSETAKEAEMRMAQSEVVASNHSQTLAALLKDIEDLNNDIGRLQLKSESNRELIYLAIEFGLLALVGTVFVAFMICICVKWWTKRQITSEQLLARSLANAAMQKRVSILGPLPEHEENLYSDIA